MLKSALRSFNNWRVEQYYRRTVSDRALADAWARHYLAGLPIEPGARVLDHGCGRGRNAALLAQLGFRVAAQDVQAHVWWRNIAGCDFREVPATVSQLPWSDNEFALVLDAQVIHHLDERHLERLAREIYRVLVPGGYWLLLEANADSYGASALLKYYGHLHTLEHVQHVTSAAGFREVDHSYEGVYAPLFPVAINFVRKQAWPGPMTVDDFGSRLEAMIPERRRALWLLRLRKPR